MENLLLLVIVVRSLIPRVIVLDFVWRLAVGRPKNLFKLFWCSMLSLMLRGGRVRMRVSGSLLNDVKLRRELIRCLVRILFLLSMI